MMNELRPEVVARQAAVTKALFVLMLSLLFLLTIITIAGMVNDVGASSGSTAASDRGTLDVVPIEMDTIGSFIAASPGLGHP